MIGGGKWIGQNKTLNGAYVNFISKKSNLTSKTNISNSSGSDINPDATCVFLLDVTGVYLKTADEQYLAVQSV